MSRSNMYDWAKDLFPINRSITGPGTRQTLAYLQKINSEINEISFSTGEKVFDWQIPKEWHVREAWFEHVDTGQRFADLRQSNLHVVGYSKAVDKIISKDELLQVIHTQPNQPKAIPYVTSYYQKKWGFCISDEVKNRLPDGSYHVYIDAEHIDGALVMGEGLIEGYLKKEILFSTYICHPSMANNELSGPVVTSALMRYIKNTYSEPKFSYRFLFVPETIGSIAYLSRNLASLQNNVLAGFVVSCVGDERAFSHIHSRYGETLADKALASALIGRKNVKNYSFLERGSDERQYCSPGVDLPVCGFSKTKYGQFPEYHTHLDNFDVVTEKGLNDALKVLIEIVDALELGLYPINEVLCEPQLGKRKLYPTLSNKSAYSGKLRTRMDVLAYSDGTNTIFEICKIINKPLTEVTLEIKMLMEHGLIRVTTEENIRI